MEQQWSGVITPGQKVLIKSSSRNYALVDVPVDQVQFISKLSSTYTYYYATAKVYVTLPDCSSSSEYQFRDVVL